MLSGLKKLSGQQWHLAALSKQRCRLNENTGLCTARLFSATQCLDRSYSPCSTWECPRCFEATMIVLVSGQCSSQAQQARQLLPPNESVACLSLSSDSAFGFVPTTFSFHSS